MRLPRRNFTTGLLAGGIAIGIPSAVYQYLSQDPPTPRQLLIGVISQMRGVPGFYGAFKDPNPRLVLQAENRLLERLATVPKAFSTEATLVTALQATMHQEIIDGQTTQLNEILMSQTEADLILCALMYAPAVEESAIANENQNEFAVNPRFGPRKTVVGQVFNEQPDGHGGIWISTDGPLPATTKIEISGQLIKTTWKSNVVTGAVYGDLLQKIISATGEHEVALLDTDTGGRQVIGAMKVEKRPPPALTENGQRSNVFCRIDRVQKKPIGEKVRLSVHTQCSPRGATILIGDSSIKTKFNDGVITAELPDALSAASGDPWRLFDPVTGDTVKLPPLT